MDHGALVLPAQLSNLVVACCHHIADVTRMTFENVPYGGEPDILIREKANRAGAG